MSASDHILCWYELSRGCSQCYLPSLPICCKLCFPASFMSFVQIKCVESIDRPVRWVACTWVKSWYDPKLQDCTLRDALHAFCKEHTVHLFGTTMLKTLGSALIMPNDILQQIVDGAHFHLIHNILDLANLTHWICAAELGANILGLICLHHPPPPS